MAAAAMRLRLYCAATIVAASRLGASGNAQLGFVARSQVFRDGRFTSGSAWVVPPQLLYPPIRQDAVLLSAGKDNPAAHALLEFLQSPPVRALIDEFGCTH
jgi:molybdate transport system substrate-binding protein